MNSEVKKYLAAQPKLQREILEAMHAVCMDTIPETTDKISYGIIGFTYGGKVPFFISGWKNHVSIHGGRKLGKLAQAAMPELKVVGTTIQIDLAKPLTPTKLKKIIKLRLQIFDESGGKE
jgi:uncharacterized protein YdhG (YjbR/CyaY superfamily)